MSTEVWEHGNRLQSLQRRVIILTYSINSLSTLGFCLMAHVLFPVGHPFSPTPGFNNYFGELLLPIWTKAETAKITPRLSETIISLEETWLDMLLGVSSVVLLPRALHFLGPESSLVNVLRNQCYQLFCCEQTHCSTSPQSVIPDLVAATTSSDPTPIPDTAARKCLPRRKRQRGH